MKKNITIVTQYFPPDQAATGQFIESLVKELTLSEGWKFTIHTGQPAYVKIKVPKKTTYQNKLIKINRSFLSNLIPSRYLGRIINSFLFCLYNLIKLTLTHNKDELIIFTSEPPFLSFLSYFLFRIRKIKYILIIYDLYPETLVNLKILNKNGFFTKLWERLNQYSYQNANQIIVLSENMKTSINKKYKNINHKISIISSWDDPEKIYPIDKCNNWFIKEQNLQSKFVVLYSGNQGRLHDFKTIMEAGRLLKSEKDIVFLFIGNGNKHNYLINEVKNNDLINCIFMNYQPKDHLLYTLNSADIAIITIAKNAEGIIAPSKLYGHLAAGTSIAAIAPSKSYLSNLVEEYKIGKSFKNGESIELANWINFLSKNKEVNNRYSESARSLLLKTASKKIIISKYKKILKTYI